MPSLVAVVLSAGCGLGAVVALLFPHTSLGRAFVILLGLLSTALLAWLMALTVRLRRTADEARANASFLQLLERVAVAANESDSVHTAVRICLDLICEHTGWPAGHAFLQDDQGELRPSGIWHLDPEVAADLETFRRITEATRFGTAAGPPARVLATGHPTWIDDLAEDRGFLNGELAEELGVRATFAVPVPIGREVVAVLEFFAPHPVELDPRLLEVMRHVAAQLGRVMERERATAALRAEEISHHALHDSLTGLPNMTLYIDRLTSALSRLARKPGTVAVMFLDLDRFKHVNDTFGHSAANDLLAQAAERLQGAVRPSDTVARFGGDEFVVLCEDLPGKDDALRIAARIVETMSQPFEAGGRPATTSTSVGVALATGPSDDPEQLITNADRAMYRAKRKGRARYEVFDERMRAQARGRRRVETALRGALERGELMLYFQPAIRLIDGATVGAEALLRWKHPERGILAAQHFLPVAEESGLIAAIDAWAMDEAIRWLGEWRDLDGDEYFMVSLNMSARHFSRPELAQSVERSLSEAGAPPAGLCVEVPEAVLTADPQSALSRIRALKDLGVRFAIDDFGAGTASLGHVTRFPIDVVKLDRSLIEHLGRSEERDAMVRAVLTMAHELDLVTVAEGVETPDQARSLQELGCDRAQGNLWCRPQPPEAFTRMVERPALRGA